MKNYCFFFELRIGRIIRHKHDFGAIIFVDARFSFSNTTSLLPKWVVRNHEKFDNPTQLTQRLRGFFNKMAAYQRRGLLNAPVPVDPIKTEHKLTTNKNNSTKKMALTKNIEAIKKEKSSFTTSVLKDIIKAERGNGNTQRLRENMMKKSILDIDEEKCTSSGKYFDPGPHFNPKSLKREAQESPTSSQPTKRKKIKIVRKDDMEDTASTQKVKEESKKFKKNPSSRTTLYQNLRQTVQKLTLLYTILCCLM